MKFLACLFDHAQRRTGRSGNAPSTAATMYLSLLRVEEMVIPSSVGFSSVLSGRKRGRKSPRVSIAFKRTFTLSSSNLASTEGKARAANLERMSSRDSSGFSLRENGVTVRGLRACRGEDSELGVRSTCEINPRILQLSRSCVCACSRRPRTNPMMSVQEEAAFDICHALFSASAANISIWNRRKVGVLVQHFSRARSRIPTVEQFTADPLVPDCVSPSSQSQRPAILSKTVPTRVVNTSSWSLSCLVWDMRVADVRVNH